MSNIVMNWWVHMSHLRKATLIASELNIDSPLLNFVQGGYILVGLLLFVFHSKKSA